MNEDMISSKMAQLICILRFVFYDNGIFTKCDNVCIKLGLGLLNPKAG